MESYLNSLPLLLIVIKRREVLEESVQQHFEILKMYMEQKNYSSSLNQAERLTEQLTQLENCKRIIKNNKVEKR